MEANVKCFGTEVLFYDDIDRRTAAEFAIRLDEAAREAIGRELVGRPAGDRVVNIRINSPGGDVDACLAMVDTIRRYQARGLVVDTSVDGYAASAATVVLQAGSTRRMGRHATLKIHQVRTETSGRTSDLREVLQNMSVREDVVKSLYLARWKAGRQKLDALFAQEKLLPADECLKLGLVDEVV